jgi:hypothetical protein
MTNAEIVLAVCVGFLAAWNMYLHANLEVVKKAMGPLCAWAMDQMQKGRK